MILEDKTVLNNMIVNVTSTDPSIITITRNNGVVEFINLGQPTYSLDALSSDKNSFVEGKPLMISVPNLASIAIPTISDVYINQSDNKVYVYNGLTYNIVMDLNVQSSIKIVKYIQGRFYKKGMIVSYLGNHYKAFENTNNIATGFVSVKAIDMFIDVCEIQLEGFSGYVDIAATTVTKVLEDVTTVSEFNSIFSPQTVASEISSTTLLTEIVYTVPQVNLVRVDGISVTVTYDFATILAGEGMRLHTKAYNISNTLLLYTDTIVSDSVNGDVTMENVAIESLQGSINPLTYYEIDDLVSGDIFTEIPSVSVPATKTVTFEIDLSNTVEKVGFIKLQSIAMVGKTNLWYTVDNVKITYTKEV